MARLNYDPIAALTDGSHLLVSTRHLKEGAFACQVYLANSGDDGKLALRAVSDDFHAPTCRQAQEIAYGYAQRMYPGMAEGMKKPPYLVWAGPGRPA